MKKFYLVLLFILIFSANPTLAKTATPTAKKTWQPTAPEGYSPITWAKAAGIASFFKAPEGNGAIDFITRIYLPQNQIEFITTSSTPLDLEPANPSFFQNIAASTTENFTSHTVNSDNIKNLSFERLVAEKAKIISPATKFLWDVSFFNMKPTYTDLSMAIKYSVGATTTISSGSRSIPDMAKARRMLIINNKTGKATIKDFDSSAFTDSKTGDQAVEGFAPTVAINDDSSSLAARLFLGVTDDSQELVIYCSKQASIEDASKALIAAGVSLEHQLEADGGGSAACGYNLPGQFFVEPTRTLPVMMGAVTILARGTATTDGLNVRSGPGTKYSVVTKLAKNETIRVFEEKNGWYRIGLGQWVLKTLIKKS